MEQMFDLSFKISPADGHILLEQTDYGGESERVALHPAQLRFIAERAGLLAPAVAPPMPPGLARRLIRLRGRAEALFDLLDSVPSWPPQSNPTQDVIAASDMLDEIDALLEDYQLVTTADQDSGAASPEPASPHNRRTDAAGEQLGLPV